MIIFQAPFGGMAKGSGSRAGQLPGSVPVNKRVRLIFLGWPWSQLKASVPSKSHNSGRQIWKHNRRGRGRNGTVVGRRKSNRVSAREEKKKKEWNSNNKEMKQSTPAAGGPVTREWHVARLDLPDVLHEPFIVPFHLFGRLPADGPCHVVPAVGQVLVVLGQGRLEQLVLLRGPGGAHRTGRHLFRVKS